MYYRKKSLTHLWQLNKNDVYIKISKFIAKINKKFLGNNIAIYKNNLMEVNARLNYTINHSVMHPFFRFLIIFCRMSVDILHFMIYNKNMIKSFKHKRLEKFFLSGSMKGINPDHARKISMILLMLQRAKVPEDMNFVGSRLHKYTNSNIWSVDVSGNYRILFKFENNDTYDINYQDPH